MFKTASAIQRSSAQTRLAGTFQIVQLLKLKTKSGLSPADSVGQALKD
jgi:hypothetical protein